MFERIILTEIDIEAGPDRVWEVLTDFASYPEWNPMIRTAAGEIAEGARIHLHFEPEGSRGHDYHPRLLVVAPGRELRWLGQPSVKGVLSSEHYFRLEAGPDETTHLVHGMDFEGLLIPVVGGYLERGTIGPFDDMNHALKKRAEQT